MAAKTQVPAVEGWFTMDPDRPSLLGSQCAGCGAIFFPRETMFCRNPACQSREFGEIELSRTGTIWSFTDNRYQPPAPYVSPDPFVPYTIAAVELAAEQMVVLGQVEPGTDLGDLHAGMAVELVLGTLYEDDDHEYLVWRWRPLTDQPTGQPTGQEVAS
jgi:uncharacterized OB-fold protein